MSGKPKKPNERVEPSPENVQALLDKLTAASNQLSKSKTYENAVEVQRVKRTRGGMIDELRKKIGRVK